MRQDCASLLVVKVYFVIVLYLGLYINIDLPIKYPQLFCEYTTLTIPFSFCKKTHGPQAVSNSQCLGLIPYMPTCIYTHEENITSSHDA